MIETYCLLFIVNSFLLHHKWCRWPESNRHSSRHTPLKRACLPISPHRLILHFLFSLAFGLLSSLRFKRCQPDILSGVRDSLPVTHPISPHRLNYTFYFHWRSDSCPHFALSVASMTSHQYQYFLEVSTCTSLCRHIKIAN